MYLKYIKAVLILLGAFSCLGQHGTPTVNIEGLGRVQGTIEFTAWTSRTIYEFQGIPYGQAPVGPLRFQPTVKVSPWVNTRDASKPGIRCPQLVEEYVNVDDEDCLTLSVYSNNLDAVRPVMVFIHGGWFFYGGADDYKPNYLLESDIVLVVIQYRLGPLGFLSTMTDDIPGNVGILDMITALEWVQQYIGYFGGNSSQVTVFGESAGAAAVSAMLHSPFVQSRSTPLFQKAIMQSGSVFTPWAVSNTPLEGSNDIVARLGCSEVAVDQCLRVRPIRQLLEVFTSHREQTIVNRGYPYVAGTGIVVGGPSPLFPEHPIHYLDNASKNVSIMAGTTSQDGLFLLEELYRLQPHLLDIINTSQGLVPIIRIFHEKFGHTRFDGSLEGYAIQDNFFLLIWEYMVSTFADICGIYGIKAPVMKEIHAFNRGNPRNVFLYSFDYSSALIQRNLTIPFPYSLPVQHGDDLNYLFPRVNLSEADTVMAKTMVQLWTSFAISGIPTAKEVPNWPPADRLYGPYLKINTESEQQSSYLKEFFATFNKYLSENTDEEDCRAAASVGSIMTILIVSLAVNLVV